MSLEISSIGQQAALYKRSYARREQPEVVSCSSIQETQPAAEPLQAEKSVSGSLVRLTSTNRRRQEVLKAAGFTPVSVTPPHEEPQIRETHLIAAGKVRDTVPTVTDATPGDFFVGSDALIYIGDRHAGKPDSHRVLKKNLRSMAQNGGYDVRSHTVVTQYPDNPAEELQFSHFPFGTRVKLNPEKAAVLGTSKGARQYEKAFKEFYDGKITYEKVASGVCVLVLVAMGMVEELDGVKLTAQQPQESLQALYGSTFTAIMNVAPQALFHIRHALNQHNDETTWNEIENIPEAQALAQKAFARFEEKTALR